MKLLIAALSFIPALAFADCPNPFQLDNKDYCMNLQWEQTQKRIKADYEPASEMSPHLITMGEPQQKWRYSKATITFWEKADLKEKPIEIPNFKVFPYMNMKSGHHHGASHYFYFDKVLKTYTLEKMALQKMMGCWSLRGTTGKPNAMDDSVWVMDVTDFENLSEDEVLKQQSACQTVNSNRL
mgnify:CR=1 FL=1